MTGDSISDAEALQLADVGLCMGSGCDVAKDNSDLIITDNNFVSIQKTVQWGRSIFENVRKFIQFQMTINLVLCFMTILGGCTLGTPPLNVVQMLWTNLIMDVLAAISIGTEPYNPSIQVARISRRSEIILPEMWRQIVGHAVYQIIVLCVLMYFGQFIFFPTPFNIITTPSRDDQQAPTAKLELDTLIFHTFILMNLFNQINCRVVDKDELNVFKTLSPVRHPWFWAILAFEITVQQFMICGAETTLGSALLGGAPLSLPQQLVAWVLGASELVTNLIIKQIPIGNFQFFAEINLEAKKKGDAKPKLSEMLQLQSQDAQPQEKAG